MSVTRTVGHPGLPGLVLIGLAGAMGIGLLLYQSTQRAAPGKGASQAVQQIATQSGFTSLNTTPTTGGGVVYTSQKQVGPNPDQLASFFAELFPRPAGADAINASFQSAGIKDTFTAPAGVAPFASGTVVIQDPSAGIVDTNIILSNPTPATYTEKTLGALPQYVPIPGGWIDVATNSFISDPDHTHPPGVK